VRRRRCHIADRALEQVAAIALHVPWRGRHELPRQRSRQLIVIATLVAVPDPGRQRDREGAYHRVIEPPTSAIVSGS